METLRVTGSLWVIKRNMTYMQWWSLLSYIKGSLQLGFGEEAWVLLLRCYIWLRILGRSSLQSWIAHSQVSRGLF